MPAESSVTIQPDPNPNPNPKTCQLNLALPYNLTLTQTLTLTGRPASWDKPYNPVETHYDVKFIEPGYTATNKSCPSNNHVDSDPEHNCFLDLTTTPPYRQTVKIYTFYFNATNPLLPGGEIYKEAVDHYNARIKIVYNIIENFPKPTIAMINGYCIGGGLNLAACTDFRIVSDKSQFAMPAAKLALGYPFDFRYKYQH